MSDTEAPTVSIESPDNEESEPIAEKPKPKAVKKAKKEIVKEVVKEVKVKPTTSYKPPRKDRELERLRMEEEKEERIAGRVLSAVRADKAKRQEQKRMIEKSMLEYTQKRTYYRPDSPEPPRKKLKKAVPVEEEEEEEEVETAETSPRVVAETPDPNFLPPVQQRFGVRPFRQVRDPVNEDYNKTQRMKKAIFS